MYRQCSCLYRLYLEYRHLLRFPYQYRCNPTYCVIYSKNQSRKNFFLQKDYLTGQVLNSSLQPRYKVKAGREVISVLGTVSPSRQQLSSHKFFNISTSVPFRKLGKISNLIINTYFTTCTCTLSFGHFAQGGN